MLMRLPRRVSLSCMLCAVLGAWLLSGSAAFGQAPGPATHPSQSPATQTAAEASTTAPGGPEDEQFSLHGQATVVSQHHDAFPAPYSGFRSLPRHEPWRTSVTGTLFMGARLWEGAQAYFDPEIAGGEGFGGVSGIAGFTNGEIPRVASPTPEPYVARLFFRQTFGFGGEKEKVEADQNQLAGSRDVSRLTFSVGKMAATDFFDNNAYSHDPRTQYLNWSLMDNGAWDFPADVRGYSIGAVAELNQPHWTLRYGAFDMPKAANGGTLDSHVLQSLGHVLEYEQRYSIRNHPGAARLLAYANTAHMGNYRQATDHPAAGGPDVTRSRAYTAKYGLGLSLEQELTPDLGFFSRIGWNDGHTETFAFTEIDRTVSAGLSLKGTRWSRPNDVVGVGYAANGLSRDHRDYLAAGGYGFIIGDGRLHYGWEQIGEAYYSIKAWEHVFITPDTQFIVNPAYNRDRGPVFVIGVRVHAEF